MPPILSNVVPTAFDAAFIEQCVRELGKLEPDNHVVAVTEEQLTGHEGNSGTILKRLRISYAREQTGIEPPKSLVLKLSDTSKLKGASQRDTAVERLIVNSSGMSDVNMLQREAIFYNKFHEMVSDPCGMKIPEIYFTAISGHSNVITRALFILFKRKEHVKGAILMEDLSAGRNLDAVEMCPPDILATLCTEIGRLYGYTAKAIAEGHGKIGPYSRLPKAFTYQMCLMTAGIPRIVKRRWTPKSNLIHKVIMRWGDSDYRILKENTEVRQALLSLEKQFVPHVNKLYGTIHKYNCVLQGDFHAGNFMLMPDGQVKMFDMQMWGIGHPAEELCYFLASNVDPNQEVDDLAMTRVHNAMEIASQGITEYPLERLKRDVDICTLHYMAASIVRRALFESPESVAKLTEKIGHVMDGIQRVCRAREQRLLLRVAQIWRREPNFSFLPRVEEANAIPKALESIQLDNLS